MSHSDLTHRKAGFKAPRTVLDGALQHSRRVAALAAQQQARAKKQNAYRTDIDQFAALSLGTNGDSDEDATIDKSEGLAKYVRNIQLSEPGSTPKTKQPSRWANLAMYAELLEMNVDETMDMTGNSSSDGIPPDLQEGWIAVAPLPAGKRCLAVSTSANGLSGIVSKISLKSRLKGHTLLNFPSTLPPDTILDCILDASWQETGILHILDVIRWRGREFDDCSADMRFWWRDVRLSEIGCANPVWAFEPNKGFRFPVKFIPIPYVDRPSYENLLSSIIPQCRSQRTVDIEVPMSRNDAGDKMDVDQVELRSVSVSLDPDGILLYVRESYYESGTSPLCVWVPSKVQEGLSDPLSDFEKLIRKRIIR